MAPSTNKCTVAKDNKVTSVSAPGSQESTPSDQSPPAGYPGKQHKRSHSESDTSRQPLHQPPPTAPKPEKSKPSSQPSPQLQQDCKTDCTSHSDEDLPPPPPPEMLALDIAQAEQAASTSQSLSNGAMESNGDSLSSRPSSVLQKAQMYDSGGHQDSGHHHQQVKDSTVSQSSGNVKRQGSVVASHKDVMQALNEKLAVVSQLSPSGPGHQGPHSPVNKSGPVNCTNMESDNDITPTAESPGNSLLAQLQTGGIRLRKAYSNDRSSPRTS